MSIIDVSLGNEKKQKGAADSTDWNSKENAKIWRKDLADYPYRGGYQRFRVQGHTN